MNVEFHYYMTCLIAARAGFGPGDAATIAYASQYVDDNDMIFEVSRGTGAAFRNYISQTMNILKPKPKLFRIYPVFHFIPGDPRADTAWRKDGKMHWLNTTPDSKNARQVLAAALASEDLYRIGIALHGYADSWAHQNFVGYYEAFNSMTGPLATVCPNIGHADAGHNPDEPALVWRDKRMLAERVDNRERLLDAADHILTALCGFVDPGLSGRAVSDISAQLRQDLVWAIGGRDQGNNLGDDRVGRYRELCERAAYGGRRMPDYDPDAWFDRAVSEDVRGLRDRSDFTLARWDPLTDVFTWNDPEGCAATDWHRFQAAVKVHQGETLEILAGTNLRGLELPEM